MPCLFYILKPQVCFILNYFENLGQTYDTGAALLVKKNTNLLSFFIKTRTYVETHMPYACYVERITIFSTITKDKLQGSYSIRILSCTFTSFKKPQHDSSLKRRFLHHDMKTSKLTTEKTATQHNILQQFWF